MVVQQKRLSSPDSSLPPVISALRPLVDLVAGIPVYVHTKLLVAFLVGSVLLMAMGVLSIVIIERMSSQLHELSLLQDNVNHTHRMEYLITAQSHFRAMALLTGYDSYNEDVAFAKEGFLEHLDAVEGSLFHQVDTVRQIRASNDEFSTSSAQVQRLFDQGRIDEALEVHIAEEHEVSHDIEEGTRELIATSTMQMDQAVADFQSDRWLLTGSVVGFSVASLLIATGLGLIVSGAFIRPVRRIDRVLAEIASGNFNQRVTVPNRDEFGTLSRNVNKMTEQLSMLYGELQQEIDERKRVEDQLLDARSNLENIVEERTEQLRSEISERARVQEQLVNAQKMEAVGRLSGGIAHDFNNLLTPILGYAHLGATTKIYDPVTKKYFQSILDAAESACSLTRQFLILARGHVSERQDIDLNDFLSSKESLINDLIGPAIRLELVLDPHLSLVHIDPSQIEQALLNLVVNARDAMPDGGSLIIDTGNVNRDGNELPGRGQVANRNQVAVSVTDSGTGMTKEIRDRVFDPFFTSKDVSRGTGLGLSICYAIVEQNGGHIEVSSEPGRGATFTMYFPGSLATYVASDPVKEIDHTPRGTETILVVEDDPAVRQFIAEVLVERGYDVLEVSNGEEALRVFESRPSNGVDLLLSDIIMPEMDGVELVGRVRAIHPDIRVILSSGYVGDGISEDVTLEADDLFLQKPYTPEELAKKVRYALDQR